MPIHTFWIYSAYTLAMSTEAVNKTGIVLLIFKIQAHKNNKQRLECHLSEVFFKYPHPDLLILNTEYSHCILIPGVTYYNTNLNIKNPGFPST